MPNTYAAGDEGKVVSNGALVAQTARASEITQNGTYDTTENNSVTVNVSGGGGSSIPLLTLEQWEALSAQQKRAYGLVVIQDANSGFDRGELVYGANYIGSILQSGTAASSASVNVSVTGSYKLIVIALNSEASTYDLTLSVTLNNTAISGETLVYNQYYSSGNDRRNYRVNSYDIEVESGDTIAIELTNRSGYTSFVYLITDANITEIDQRRSTADAICSGSYTNNAVVLQGTFNSSSGGTVNLQAYTANKTIQTDNPGSSYKSAYIFWCDTAEISEYPSSIVIDTLPLDTVYTDGDEIDYMGMVVKAYRADGTLWTNETYTDGIIPLNELVLPDTHADLSKVVNEQEYPEYQDSGTVVVTSVGSIRKAFDEAISHINGTVDDGGIFENYIYPKLDMYEGTNPGIVSVYKNAPQNFSGYSPIDIYIFTDVEVGDELALGNRGIPETVISFAAQGSGGTLRIVDYSVGTASSLLTMVTTGQSEGSGYYSVSSVNASVIHFGQQPLAVKWNSPVDDSLLTTEVYITVEASGNASPGNS